MRQDLIRWKQLENNKTMNKKSILIILDGWGEGDSSEVDLIQQAKTPFYDGLKKEYPFSLLKASGEAVGLPQGQMGNSEVGHLNIGAGRVVYQDIVKINKAIEDKSIERNAKILQAFQYAKEKKKKLHFLGLVSDGGVHSSMQHLKKIIEMADKAGLENSFLHVLTDGRDTDPYSGIQYVQEMEAFIDDKNTKIASICGRYYTMDRDKRWERVKQGYDLLTKGKGEKFSSAKEAIEDSYAKKITDEFIKPSVITDKEENPIATIEEGDIVFCFNFRTDRLREITTVLTQKDMPEFGMQTIPLHYLTMTTYDESFKDVHIAFENQVLEDTLGEVLAKNNKTQLRIAETEKYPHVSFFFSGGREDVFSGEDRFLIPSPKVATYDLKPAMSAIEVKDAVVEKLNQNTYDFICLNFANADMVGHTGVREAIIEALETVDKCLKEVVSTARKNKYSVMIIADHGNADSAINKDGSPNTAHSLNPVPCVVLDESVSAINNGSLCNVAPSILKIMQLQQPDRMTAKSLF